VLFSEPKIPQFSSYRVVCAVTVTVSVLFSEPKIPQYVMPSYSSLSSAVSVLFSEPKIPQFWRIHQTALDDPRCFSALQRAENSSIFGYVVSYHIPLSGFSALQRAENSSMARGAEVLFDV